MSYLNLSRCLRGKLTLSVTDDETMTVFLPHSNGSASEELDNVKENQKSQSRNVLCCIVEVKQYYCLSYRMWKGVIIRCVVPVCRILTAFCPVWIKVPILSVSLYTATPPPQQPPKLQYKPPHPLQWLSPSKGLIIMGYFLSRWPQVYRCMYFSTQGQPKLPVQRKGLKLIHNIIVIEILSSSLLLLWLWLV